MNEEQIDRLIELFSQVGSQAWTIALQGVWANIIANFVILIIFAGLIYASILVIRHAWRKGDDPDYMGFWDSDTVPTLVVSLAASDVLLVIIGLFMLYDLIIAILAPEWAAVHNLLELVN